MVFIKIDAKDKVYKDVKSKYERVYNDFKGYLIPLSPDKSGKPYSYANYLIRFVILYEMKFGPFTEKLDTFEGLHELERVVNLNGFTEYNISENRFPSATIKSFRSYIVSKKMIFEELTDELLNQKINNSQEPEDVSDILKMNTQLILEPQKRAEAIKTSQGIKYPRNIAESLAAKRNSSYKCDIDAAHETFINIKDKNPYIEAHHLIPMAAQGYFENTIDFADNIVSLCPNCHRKIHYGLEKVKKEMIITLFKKRQKLYPNYGINIDKKTLLSFYNII